MLTTLSDSRISGAFLAAVSIQCVLFAHSCNRALDLRRMAVSILGTLHAHSRVALLATLTLAHECVSLVHTACRIRNCVAECACLDHAVFARESHGLPESDRIAVRGRHTTWMVLPCQATQRDPCHDPRIARTTQHLVNARLGLNRAEPPRTEFDSTDRTVLPAAHLSCPQQPQCPR